MTKHVIEHSHHIIPFFLALPQKETKNASHDKAIASHQSLPGLHASFFGDGIIYFYIMTNSYRSICNNPPDFMPENAIPTFRSLSLDRDDSKNRKIGFRTTFVS